MIPLSETEHLLAQLVGYPTVSDDSNLELIAFVADRLQSAGARVDILADATGTKANLLASFGHEQDGGILLSGHTDVVPVTDQAWSSNPFRLTEKNGLLYGRGTCDMKGFVAAVLAMAPRYGKTPLRRPLHIALTHDEEVGCIGARALVPQMEARGLRPDLAIVGEPTGMKIVDGHKGCCEYTVRFTGLEGHGSKPDKGLNAVLLATRYVARLLALAEELKARAPEGSRFDPPWTTINIGALHGGSVHNIIPGKATLDWEMRPVDWADADFVKRRIDAFVRDELLPEMQSRAPQAGVETDVIGEVVGLGTRRDNAARDLLAELTGCNTADVVPFGTEAGLFQGMGMSVAVCGPGNIAQAHKPDEYVSRDQLVQCLKMLDRLGDRIAA